MSESLALSRPLVDVLRDLDRIVKEVYRDGEAVGVAAGLRDAQGERAPPLPCRKGVSSSDVPALREAVAELRRLAGAVEPGLRALAATRQAASGAEPTLAALLDMAMLGAALAGTDVVLQWVPATGSWKASACYPTGPSVYCLKQSAVEAVRGLIDLLKEAVE